MTQKLIRRIVSALGITSMIALTSSCVYDPYYGGGAQASYGYSNGSTSVFVSTGDPRWGYDPYCYSYYDYHRRAYYDPYRYGYYPVGYRPPIVYGVPHPYGWRPGSRYCPPPRRVTNVTLVNYRNRESAYRQLDYSWARNTRQREDGRSWSGPGRESGSRRDIPNDFRQQRNNFGRDRDGSGRRSDTRLQERTSPFRTSADTETRRNRFQPENFDRRSGENRNRRGQEAASSPSPQSFRRPDPSPQREIPAPRMRNSDRGSDRRQEVPQRGEGRGYRNNSGDGEGNSRRGRGQMVTPI